MAPKEIGHFPYVVTFRTSTGRRKARWRPMSHQKSQDLTFAMVPSFQRGGITGDFQTIDSGRSDQAEFQAFIPWDTILIILTAKSFERLHGDGLTEAGTPATGPANVPE